MTYELLEIRIEELLLTHREVKKKKAGRYVMKYKRGEVIEPVSVAFCVHTGKYLLDDGHHRVAAAHFSGKSSILAEIEPCYINECTGFEPDQEPYHNIRHIILE